MTNDTHDDDGARCPLCSGPNQCALVEGRRHCWCYEIEIPRATLARVPLHLRDLVCICQGCATRKPSDESPL
jgi:hypothetical protein